MSRNARKRAFSLSTRRTRFRRLFAGLTVLGIIAVACWVVHTNTGPDDATAQAPRRAPQNNASSQANPRAAKPKVVAVVNGKPISREEISQICLNQSGEEVLEALMNKRLIEHYCSRQGIQITNEEVDAEITRIARRMGFNRQQYLDILKKHRNISPQQYAQDIVWTTIALRKLAKDQVEPTPEEIQMAYESTFGPAIKSRIIVLENEADARRVHALALAKPEEFARLARNESKDINSASNGGLIPPIRRHLGDPKIEATVFQMQPGTISPILNVTNQFIIVKCEEHIPARNVPLEETRPQLVERLREKKLRRTAGAVLKQLQQNARVENIFNDPERRRQMPGVAATINDQPITIAELAEMCFESNGTEVLETEINRQLLTGELARRQIEVTQEDLQAEIAHAAQLSGIVDAQNRPDISAWFKTVLQERGVSQESYIQNAVWPSTALKKLTVGEVKITNEDMQKGFEANFGPRVRCRAIVLDSHRRAQEVWAKARQTPTVEYFAKLAQEYSIEPGSRDTGGEVPPIQRHSGRPILENEAFKLKPGELSGVLQVGKHYVILLCEGHTEPLNVKFEEVRDQIYRDLYEKKLRQAMASSFDQIRAAAQIDNFLTGTTHSPKRKAKGAASRPAKGPAIRQATHQAPAKQQPTRQR